MSSMGSTIRKLTAPQNLTALACDSIKRHILEGKLDEETRLTEEFLSNRLGIRFHAAIASATGNDELCPVLKNIQDQIWLCRCKTYSLSSSTASEAHLMILKALEENDTKGAQTAMRNHIDHVRTRLIDFLERDSRLKAVEHS
jgi:DNA-binding GntR family transcriptional regulator